MDDIWIEKYRPKVLDEVVGQDEIVERLKAYVKTKNVPHLLFAGPAGTGKTTCTIALAKELFGESWKQNFIEMNASDERGIGIIRGKIKDFARTVPIGKTKFKIIFLDEADNLTSDAQSALRRTIEKYTHICRFILSANYSSRIIEPIQSRCTVFRFSPIKEADIKKYINKIASAEKIELTPDGLETLIFISRGDLRKAINILQVGASTSKKITAELIYETSATAKPEDIKNLITTALGGNFMAARNQLYDLLIKYGLSGEDIIKQIHQSIFDLALPDETKVKLIEKAGEIEFRLIEGSNAHIQLEALLANFVLEGSKLR
ncbi:MAG: replication factor C small subunit [Candidatus Thermoplasmatota archaeon]|jgi:replication factor C small subunit|nr:replication factor C small subunit [Candidatus Thermoplasmatota archaeon]